MKFDNTSPLIYLSRNYQEGYLLEILLEVREMNISLFPLLSSNVIFREMESDFPRFRSASRMVGKKFLGKKTNAKGTIVFENGG